MKKIQKKNQEALKKKNPKAKRRFGKKLGSTKKFEKTRKLKNSLKKIKKHKIPQKKKKKKKKKK